MGIHAVSAYVLEPLEDGDLLSLGKLLQLVGIPLLIHFAHFAMQTVKQYHFKGSQWK